MNSTRAGAKESDPSADALRTGLLTQRGRGRQPWGNQNPVPASPRGLTPGVAPRLWGRQRPFLLPRMTPALRRSHGHHSHSPGDKGVAQPLLISPAQPLRPQARLPQVRREQVTAPARPTPPAASPRPALCLHHLDWLRSSSVTGGRPAPTHLRASGPAGAPHGVRPAPLRARRRRPRARTSSAPAAAGSAEAPSAARLTASNRLHCDAASSAGQSGRGGREPTKFAGEGGVRGLGGGRRRRWPRPSGSGGGGGVGKEEKNG